MLAESLAASKQKAAHFRDALAAAQAELARAEQTRTAAAAAARAAWAKLLETRAQRNDRGYDPCRQQFAVEGAPFFLHNSLRL